MPYAEGRTYHDADSHVMETPEWLFSFADPELRPKLKPLALQGVPAAKLERFMDKLNTQHSDPEYRKDDEAQLMLRKNWSAIGSYLRQDRSKALDLLGFKSQLVFNTFLSSELQRAEHGGDVAYVYGLARAHNRSIVDFCSIDKRLLSTCYVPLRDFDLARACAKEAIELGAHALLVASACPRGHSPSHLALDPVWAQAQEAGIPVVFHVGGGGTLINPDYFQNGLPAVPDFHGGAENFRSVDYMAIPFPVMQTLSALIFDGVLDRFPKLKLGVIEQGASWVPGFMKQLDSALAAFSKMEERLQKLALKPSEYVTRQVRVTPYPTEDVGWLIAQSSEDIYLFSSDYPHVEGGRNPIKRFDESIASASEHAKQRFYSDNFVDLMGPAAFRDI